MIGMRIISPHVQNSRSMFGGRRCGGTVSLLGNSAWSKTTAMRSGLTTPSEAVNTIRNPTSETFPR